MNTGNKNKFNKDKNNGNSYGNKNGGNWKDIGKRD